MRDKAKPRPQFGRARHSFTAASRSLHASIATMAGYVPTRKANKRGMKPMQKPLLFWLLFAGFLPLFAGCWGESSEKVFRRMKEQSSSFARMNAYAAHNSTTCNCGLLPPPVKYHRKLQTTHFGIATHYPRESPPLTLHNTHLHGAGKITLFYQV